MKLVVITFSLFLVILGICSNSVAQDADTSSVQDQYRLGAGDVLRIAVLGEPELNMGAQVNQQGSITYPYLGELKILGKTLSEVKEMITQGLEGDYLLNPIVTVSMESYRTVFVGGEVASTGSVAFQPGLTVEKAIVLSGGFTDRSARNRVTVESEGGDEKRVDLDYMLSPGDIVNVPRRFF